MAKNYKRFLLLTKSVRYKKYSWQLIFKLVTGLPTTSLGIFYVSPIRNYWYFDIVTWKHYIIFVLMSGLQITLIDIQHLTSRHKLWLILRERRREIFPSLHPPLSTPICSTGPAFTNIILLIIFSVDWCIDVTKLYPLFSLVWSFLTFKLNSAEVLRPLKIIIFPRRPPIIKFEGDFIKIWLIHVSFAEICQTNKLNNMNKYLIDV